jgi:hypothetical protein
MFRFCLLIVLLAGFASSGCGGNEGSAVPPKKFADPPTTEPTLRGGKTPTKGPSAAD